MSAERSLELDQERLALVSAQAPWGLFASAVCALLVFSFLWPVVPQQQLVQWFAVFSVAALLGAVQLSWFRFRPAPGARALKRRRWWFVASTGLSGLIWGAAFIYLYPSGSELHQAFLALTLGGLAAGTVVTYAAYLEVSLSFLLTSMPFVSIHFLAQRDPIHVTYGAMAAAFFFVLLMTASRLNRMVNRGLELRHENADLVGYLEDSKEKAERLNQDLTQEIAVLAHTEEELYQKKERLQVTLESIAEGVITTDVNGCIDYVNPVAELMSGWSEEDVCGRTFGQTFNLVDEDTRASVPDPIRQCLERGRVVKASGYPLLVSRDEQQEHFVEITVSPIRDRSEKIIGSILVFRDVTELRSLTRKMAYQASHDPLTGLINRREFERRLEFALESARRDNVEHAVCFLDLDQFKAVNDTCGHNAGDKLLKHVSSILQASLRESDTLARLGGDEFAVLLSGCKLSKASEIAEKLRAQVEDYRFRCQERTFQVGVSIGVIPITAESLTVAEVVGAADSACYLAKEQGRNRVFTMRPSEFHRAAQRGNLSWVEKVRLALEQNAFLLYRQQVLSLNGQQPEHGFYELLLRMVDGDKIVTPAVFISAAERFEIMPSLDRWVFQRTVDVLSGSRFADTPMAVGLNISGQSLSEEKFLDFVLGVLRASSIDPWQICFEITETGAVANLSQAQTFINRCKEEGCRFALDDFGGGLSSFSNLKHLQIDYLKIDGSFVTDMLQDPINFTIVKSVHHIGQVMGIQTIGECVEDQETLDGLRDLGIDYAQGNFIGRPEPWE